MTIELFCDNCGYRVGPFTDRGGELNEDSVILCERCEPEFENPSELIGDEHPPRMKVATYSPDYQDVKDKCGCGLQCQECGGMKVAMDSCPEHTPGVPEYKVTLADPS